MPDIETREDLTHIVSPILITIRLGKRRWAKLDLTETLSGAFNMSRTEVKRIAKDGGLSIWATK